MEISELKAELEKLHPASFGWALSCCRQNRSDAEEVLQMVYLKILQGKALFRGESKLQTWLFAVIRKTAISERRKQLLRSLGSIVSPGTSSNVELDPLAHLMFPPDMIAVRLKNRLTPEQQDQLHKMRMDHPRMPGHPNRPADQIQ